MDASTSTYDPRIDFNTLVYNTGNTGYANSENINTIVTKINEIFDIALSDIATLTIPASQINTATLLADLCFIDYDGNYLPYIGSSDAPYGTMNNMKVSNDNYLYIAGEFTSIDGSTYNRIARYTNKTELDTSFPQGTGFDQLVLGLITDSSDNSLIASGWFSSYDGSACGYIVKLNSDGTINEEFYTGMGTGFDNYPQEIEIGDDGCYYAVGGAMTSYDGNTCTGSGGRGIVKINPDGTINNEFYANASTGFNGSVYNIFKDNNGKILVLGQFTAFQDTSSNYAIRLNTDGTVDKTFDFDGDGPGNNYLGTAAFDSSDNIYLAGNFTTLDGSILRNYIFKVNNDCVLDQTFYANSNQEGLSEANHSINALEIDSNNNLWIGGSLEAYSGEYAYHIVKTSLDGVRDASTKGLQFGGQVSDLIADPSGLIVLDGGSHDKSEIFNLIPAAPEGQFILLDQLVIKNNFGSVAYNASMKINTQAENTITRATQDSYALLSTSTYGNIPNGVGLTVIPHINSQGDSTITIEAKYRYSQF